MFRILFAGAVAVVVGAMLGWIGVLWNVSQNAYQQLYGKPMAACQWEYARPHQRLACLSPQRSRRRAAR